MDTLTPLSTHRHAHVRVATAKPTEFIDVTEQVEALIAATGLRSGLVNIQTLHTTTAVVVNEHEPLLLADFASLLESAAACDDVYKHDDVGLRAANVVLGERPNGHAHCRALLLNTSVCLNVAEGRLQLGRWQRIFFVELDGPRTRELSILVMGESAR
jgi:secondary thiamine-phosphate synthase enzyme